MRTVGLTCPTKPSTELLSQKKSAAKPKGKNAVNSKEGASCPTPITTIT